MFMLCKDFCSLMSRWKSALRSQLPCRMLRQMLKVLNLFNLIIREGCYTTAQGIFAVTWTDDLTSIHSFLACIFSVKCSTA